MRPDERTAVPLEELALPAHLPLLLTRVEDDVLNVEGKQFDADFHAFRGEMKALERLVVGAANTKEVVTKVGSLRDLPKTLKTQLSNLARAQAREIGAVLYSIADQAEAEIASVKEGPLF